MWVMKDAFSSLSGASSRRHLLIEPGGRGLARLAQGKCGRFIGLAGGCCGLFELRRAPFAHVESGKLGLQPILERRKVIDKDLVLAGRCAEPEQPFLDAFKLPRLECRLSHGLLDFGAGRIRLGNHTLKSLCDRSKQPARKLSLALDAAKRCGEPRAVGALPLQHIERLGELRGDLLGMHHQLTAGGESILFATLGIEQAKLFKGMIEIVGIGAGSGDLGRMARSGRVSRLPGRVGFGHTRALHAQAAESIDQVTMAARVDQSPLVMLAMDLNQGAPHLAQELNTHAYVVEKGAASPVGTLHPAEHDSPLGLDAVLGQQCEDGMGGMKLEGGRDLPLGRAAPDERHIAP